MSSTDTSESEVSHCTGSSQISDVPSRTSQGSKPRSHEGVSPVAPMFQATNSGNDQSTKANVVRLHKAGKSVNLTATDTGSENKSSHSSTGAGQIVVQLHKGVSLLALHSSPGQLVPGCLDELPTVPSNKLSHAAVNPGNESQSTVSTSTHNTSWQVQPGMEPSCNPGKRAQLTSSKADTRRPGHKS